MFFMQRWIAIVVVKDLKVDGNHYFNLFEVKCRKEDIVEAVKAHRNVNMKEYVEMLATIFYSASNSRSFHNM